MALFRASRLFLPQLLPAAPLSSSLAASNASASDSVAASAPSQQCAYASKSNPAPKQQSSVTPVPKSTADAIPTTIGGGQAFPNDLRSTSGLGMGDSITSHTEKWMHSDRKSPMQYIQEAEPILVEGPVVASYGSDDPALGCPVEFINLKGSSYENPAVCKYTGNKYYSLPHTWKAH